MDTTPPLPWLEILAPDSASTEAIITEGALRIGRHAPIVDLALAPDPQRLVSKLHCLIEQREGTWWIVDNGSTNGTFVRHAGDTVRVDGIAALADRDVILLLGGLSENQTPRFWELTFRDPASVPADATNYAGWDPQQRTSPVLSPPAICLLYDWVQARLYRIIDNRREEIGGLRLQEQQLIRHMAERNRINGNVPVLCPYEELIEVIWGENSHHTQADVTHLIWELRKKLDTGTHPTLLETVRKTGCRLHTCSSSDYPI